MSDFYDVIDLRRTIRDYEDETISDEVIERIISAGTKAPTNDHMRDWHFIVIKDKNTVLKLINKIPEQISDEDINTILHESVDILLNRCLEPSRIETVFLYFSFN